jgi:hypothetical protein
MPRKTSAQLDAEISEALARPPRPTSPIDPSDLRVGRRFDHFGHVYEITKIGRDNLRTIRIARVVTDPLGREVLSLLEHRTFPARDFYRQHLRPIAEP